MLRALVLLAALALAYYAGTRAPCHHTAQINEYSSADGEIRWLECDIVDGRPTE